MGEGPHFAQVGEGDRLKTIKYCRFQRAELFGGVRGSAPAEQLLIIHENNLKMLNKFTNRVKCTQF